MPKPTNNGEDYDSTSIQVLKGPRCGAQASRHVHRRHVRRHRPPPHGVRGAGQRNRRSARRLLRRHQGRHPRRQFRVDRRQRSRHTDRHEGRRRTQAFGRRNRHDRAPCRRQVRPEQLQGLRRPARRRRIRRQCAVRLAAPAHLAQRQGASDGVPPWRPRGAVGGNRRHRSPRHRSAFHGVGGDVQPHRISLRHPGEEDPRAVVPQQRHQDRADRPARRQERELRLLRRHPRLRRVHEPQQVGAASEDLPCRRREGRHDGRGRDAMERLVRRERAVLHEQHPPARRRIAPDRPAAGDDPHAQQLHREGGDREEGEGRDDRRRHARRPLLRALGEGARAEVLVADQGQARLLRGAADRPGNRIGEAGRVPAREPGRREDHLLEDRGRGAGARGGAQGAGAHAAQGRAGLDGPAGQARRLPGARSGAVRALPRRGRFRRRLGQAGPRPEIPGDPAAARQDPQRRARALREARQLAGDRHAHHGARHRVRQGRIQRRTSCATTASSS